VGKTLTAESISQHVQKPLVSLSIGSRIVDEFRLQERLATEFRRAADWDAILLLDEADVVLEARSFEDVRRNGIVSGKFPRPAHVTHDDLIYTDVLIMCATVFLRELEYYKGVLFLTTNRISTMDVAFQSRIQIGIGFKDLTPAVRKEIWLSLLDLNKDGSTDLQALGEIKNKAETLAKCELNGRELRNVLNVADAYAYHQFKIPGRMSYDHVEKAVRAAVEFKKLLEAERLDLRTEQSVWAPYTGNGL
jgi:AAA+ superfamily predicted ATPase